MLKQKCNKAYQKKRIKVENKWVIVEIFACEKCSELSGCNKWEADAVKIAMKASGIVNKIIKQEDKG